MQALATSRCHFHVDREAVARCPQCRQFFCRECITEHDDRVVCAACLKKLSQTTGARRARFTGVFRAVQVLFSMLALWMFFYFAGRMLLKIPSSFHEGTMWTEKMFQDND